MTHKTKINVTCERCGLVREVFKRYGQAQPRFCSKGCARIAVPRRSKHDTTPLSERVCKHGHRGAYRLRGKRNHPQCTACSKHRKWIAVHPPVETTPLPPRRETVKFMRRAVRPYTEADIRELGISNCVNCLGCDASFLPRGVDVARWAAGEKCFCAICIKNGTAKFWAQDRCPRCFIRKDAIAKGIACCWMPVCPLRSEQIDDEQLDRYAAQFARAAMPPKNEPAVMDDGCRRIGIGH